MLWFIVSAGRRGDTWASESLRIEVSVGSEEHELAEENKDLGTLVLHFLVFVATDGWYEVIKSLVVTHDKITRLQMMLTK